MATIEAPVRPELLEASDAVIEEAVQYAEPMVLRGLLYQLTGDPVLKAMAIKRVKEGRIEIVTLAREEDVALIRRKTADFLKSYRDSGAGPIGYGPRERLPESLALIVGETIMPEALDLMIEETALDRWARSLKWDAAPDPRRLENFTVTIIGSGMGGLNAAVQLKRAGIHFQMIEKNAEVGGTWYENRYPGARVDTPSRAYTNMFGVDFPCPYPYGPHTQSQDYFEWVAEEFGLRDRITFNTEVLSLTWNDADAMWDIRVKGPDGERTLRSNAVITGVGFLSQPNIPDIEGLETFQGQSWHTARWPDNMDLRGKRIAVIGTGCTGYQLIPEIARDAAHLTIFQRTPQWIFPVAGYQSPTPPQLLWLDRNLPFHTNFLRFRLYYGAGPEFTSMFSIDPNFDDPHTRSPMNKAARDSCIAFLESKLGSDPELVKAMIPDHPPWSSRPVVVDSEYSVLDSLMRDNVTLVTSGLCSINKTGIEDNDGVQHDVDVIVFATGFRTADFLYPMTVTGRGGKTIEELWAPEGARAYLGCMVPGFPNLWMLYGPNTNGGLFVAQYHEMTMLYAMRCLEKLILDNKQSIDVKEDAYWRYNRIVDEGNKTKLWADPRAHNYWWTKHGRTSSQTPFHGYQVRSHLVRPDFNDLDVR